MDFAKKWRLAAVFCFVVLLFASPVRAEKLDLVFSVVNSTVHAGEKANVRATVLNFSAAEISWKVPAEIAAELRGEGKRFSIFLQATGEHEKILVSPRSFAAQEYTFAVPTAASGEMILELSEVSPQKLVLQIEPPNPVARDSETKKSSFADLLRDAAPEGSPKAFEPSRFFQEHISGYEPFYFIAGTESPNAKFQISFKYQLLNRHGYLAKKYPSLERFYVAYTQTSVWDWNAPSAPFFDSSYKPEFLYAWEKITGGEKDDWFRLDMQAGLQHESNGKGGLDSRSLNIGYVRPTLIFGEENSLQLTLQPRAWFYVGDLDDNPDLPEFRGYADLRAIVGWRRGLQLSATGRIGNTAEHGSLQLDLTYPMMRIFYSNFSVYLHAQYFTGYGESLLRYNERSSAFRVGFSMYR